MSSIPSAKGIDSTLALLRNPYGFIPDTCRDLEGDLFETRILFQKTICMTGAAAAEVFYSEDGLVRAGSMPKRIQRTLLGEKCQPARKRDPLSASKRDPGWARSRTRLGGAVRVAETGRVLLGGRCGIRRGS